MIWNMAAGGNNQEKQESNDSRSENAVFSLTQSSVCLPPNDQEKTLIDV